MELNKTGSGTYSSAIAEADNYTRWIVDVFRPYYGSTVLEIGLGHGSYRQYLPGEVAYVGTDIDAESVSRAKESNPEDPYFVGDICSPEFCQQAATVAGDAGRHIDTVLCANVLEHVEDDVTAVQNLLCVLPRGGRLLLYLPAHQSLYGEMDAMAGHFRRYSKSDLERLIGSSKLRKWAYINPVAAAGWWVNKGSGHASLDSPSINRQIRLFDRYVLPLSRLVTPLTTRLFGLSLYCVLEKT